MKTKTTKKVAKKVTKRPALKKPDPELSIMTLIQESIAVNRDIETIKFLIEQQENIEAKAAKKSFVKAKINFALECPKIERDKSDYAGGFTHSSLGGVTETVLKLLADNGFTYDWKQTQSDKMLTVKCILTHIDGHVEFNELSGEYDYTDDKNALQAIASANTYLQRYTLLSLLGLASSRDDDGRFSGSSQHDTVSKPRPKEFPLSIDQVTEINLMLSNKQFDRDRFFRWVKKMFNVNKVQEIPSSGYEKTKQIIEENSGLISEESQKEEVEF